jgi:S1-C subfamily serine protease
LAGLVVGINTAMLGRSHGICFAVGIDTAKFVISRILRDGRVRRARLGIAVQTVPLLRRVVRHFELAQDAAVLVTDVQDGSPATRAGLRAGDRVLRFSGAPVGGADALHGLLGDERVGTPAALDVLRGTERIALQIVPEADG